MIDHRTLIIARLGFCPQAQQRQRRDHHWLLKPARCWIKRGQQWCNCPRKRDWIVSYCVHRRSNRGVHIRPRQ